MHIARRGVLGGLGALSAGAASAAQPADWAAIAALYDRPRDIVHLEHGNWGAMARPVLAAYEAHTARINRETSYYSRREFGRDIEAVRQRVAAALGVTAGEIALTRGATEALQALIGGYNRLRAGDQVLTADLDYDSMITAMHWLKQRRGADLVRIDLPEPATYQGLIDTYEAALAAHPRVRLILLTQVSHRTGLVLPVREIVSMARARGVDAIVDSAHAWGQIDMRLTDLDADFVGLNLHKWIGAPLGVGALYIKRERIGDIDPFMGEEAGPQNDIRARVHSGTSNMAALLSAPDALDIHESIGPARKAARLKALRDHWVERLRGHPGIEMLTPADPRLYAGISSFRLSGRTSVAENAAIARTLLERDRVFTVHRAGPARGACVRVTPAVFTSMDEMERLTSALRSLAEDR